MSEFLDVHALADNEADASTAKAVEEAMQRNPQLRSEFDSILLIKQTLQGHCKGVHCEETWSACQDRLAQIERSDRVTGFVSKYSWQLCGSFVVLVLFAGLWTRSTNQSRSLDPSQVPTIAGFSPMSSSTADEFGFRKYLSEWQLQGIFRTNVDGRAVWRYDMVDGRGPFQIFVTPNVNHIEGACRREVQGLNCYSWVHKGAQFIVVADRDHAELEQIAQRINGMP
ncbi:MAG: hypothetical protein JNK63_11475 [Chthonomonas sp.]|nr:hypothetical protein [Chthonomonas sp.]